jgi:sugar/nucleoside kinase (ribokinase family)
LDEGKILLSWLIDDLLRYLERIKPWKFKVVVMPDFFIDRFVTYPGEVDTFSEALTEVAKRQGGNIHGIKQIELRGGNAANTAAALATLGAEVHPIITTSPFGLHLLKFYLEPLGIDLSNVRINGEASLTMAFELKYHGKNVNIMMGDLGSLPNFGSGSLTDNDFQLLRKADYVCVFNWAATSRLGTELAEKVFQYVKEKGKGKTYYDTGDPTPNNKNMFKLAQKVLSKKLVDIFGVNENEAYIYASYFSQKIKRLHKKSKNDELAKECARVLAKQLSSRVDLHTVLFAGSFAEDKEVIVPSFNVSCLRSTGAGDAWNAGNIFGDAFGLPDSRRLTLANAVAAYYVSSPAAEHPTLQQLMEFCSKQQTKNN